MYMENYGYYYEVFRSSSLEILIFRLVKVQPFGIGSISELWRAVRKCWQIPKGRRIALANDFSAGWARGGGLQRRWCKEKFRQRFLEAQSWRCLRSNLAACRPIQSRVPFQSARLSRKSGKRSGIAWRSSWLEPESIREKMPWQPCERWRQGTGKSVARALVANQ